MRARTTSRIGTTVVALLAFGWLCAQTTQVSERAAKEAVYRIVQHAGLLPDFVVREDATVPTAIAYIKGHERIIAYNPAFMASIIDSTGTNWAAVSVLAHEIGHHLLGHTLDPTALHPGDELACDRYSGFVLYGMGATLEQSLAAMDASGDPHGTPRHPPQLARLEAIRQGWLEAQRLHDHVDEPPFELHDDLQFVVRFAGDRNTYYVDRANKLVWFDDHARPIEFGTYTVSTTDPNAHLLTWGTTEFVLDRHNEIWSRTAHGMQMNVGRMEAYGRPTGK